MGNAYKLLRFKLLQCPHCEFWPTVDDIQPIGDRGYKLEHTCEGFKYNNVAIYGDNVRMTVQRWNKNAKGRKPW